MFKAGRYAALDIGTVTCRMLVADVDEEGGLSELDREYRIANLGEGVDASGLLKPEAMERVSEVLEGYLQILEDFVEPGGPRPQLRAVATSAARDAKNSADFEAMLADIGIPLSIVSGEEEARLGFRGASCDFSGEPLIVADIGGGSTEIVAGRAGAEPDFAGSFNVGCRRMTEKFLAGDPPTEAEIEAARSWARGMMSPCFEKLRGAGYEGRRLVAVAGTATTIVSIRDGMEVYDASRVHLARVERAQLDEVHEQLRTTPLAQRRKIVGLDPGRAPIIVAGTIILQTVLDLAGADSFTASESDILQGIVLDLAERAADEG